MTTSGSMEILESALKHEVLKGKLHRLIKFLTGIMMDRQHTRQQLRILKSYLSQCFSFLIHLSEEITSVFSAKGGYGLIRSLRQRCLLIPILEVERLRSLIARREKSHGMGLSRNTLY